MTGDSPTMRRLLDRVILVAGAGGIGSELARRYASEGARVVLGDIDLDGATRVVDQIREQGHSATAVHLDGADEESALAAVAECVDRSGEGQRRPGRRSGTGHFHLSSHTGPQRLRLLLLHGTLIEAVGVPEVELTGHHRAEIR